MTNHLSSYYEQICKAPMLKREEEYDLFLELQDDGVPEYQKEKIREKIVKANLRFVFKRAKYFSKNKPNLFKELIAAGNEGLLVGLHKYIPSTDVKFLSYAGFWIDQRIKNHMSHMRIVSLPIWKQQLAARIEKFASKLDHEPLMVELKEAFPETPEKHLEDLHKTKYLTFYLEDMNSEDPSFQIDPIGTEVESRLDKERLYAIIQELPSPQREVIELYYGLSVNSDEEMSNASIAEELRLSKEQVRQYRKEGLASLKIMLTPALRSGS